MVFNAGSYFYKYDLKNGIYRSRGDQLLHNLPLIHYSFSEEARSVFDLEDSWKNSLQLEKKMSYHCFELTTASKGLLMGSGYPHPNMQDKEAEKAGRASDFQLGFHFDHTTGLPIIPASTVKGILRSVFPGHDPGYKKNQLRIEYVKGLLGKHPDVTPDHQYQFLSSLENQLFQEGAGKVIFLDAFITGVQNDLFQEDFITPHIDKDRNINVLNNPQPLRFIKIAGKVCFKFQFICQAIHIGDITVTESQIMDIFKTIILDWGIGAKRNVDFGFFDDEKMDASFMSMDEMLQTANPHYYAVWHEFENLHTLTSREVLEDRSRKLIELITLKNGDDTYLIYSRNKGKEHLINRLVVEVLNDWESVESINPIELCLMLVQNLSWSSVSFIYCDSKEEKLGFLCHAILSVVRAFIAHRPGQHDMATAFSHLDKAINDNKIKKPCLDPLVTKFLSEYPHLLSIRSLNMLGMGDARTD